MVDTCNIALIPFLKCNVTKFRSPLLLVTQCHTSSTPSPPLTCDVIYGCPLSTEESSLQVYSFPLCASSSVSSTLGAKFVLESNAHPDFEGDIWLEMVLIRFAYIQYCIEHSDIHRVFLDDKHLVRDVELELMLLNNQNSIMA